MTDTPPPLRLAQDAVNRALALDPETLAALGELSGKVLAVEVQGTGGRFYVRLAETGVEFVTALEGAPDVSVEGSPVALLTLLIVHGDQARMPAAGVRVSGDVGLLQRIKALAERIDIDWEEPLARMVGDVAAHGIGNAVRGLQAFGRRVGATLTADTAEYLVEELRLLPSRPEVDAFLGAVDTLRDDVERIEKRIERLARSRRGQPR